MKRTPKKTADGRWQLFAVIAIVLVGMLLGTVLVKSALTAEDHGHGHGTHTEAKSHSDGEHTMTRRRATSTTMTRPWRRGAPRQDTEQGLARGQLFTDGKFSLEALLANKPAVRSCRSG